MTENRIRVAVGEHTAPSWVANVKVMPRTPIGATARILRRIYRVVFTTGVVLLWSALAYCWIAPPSLATSLGRWCLAFAAALVLPVLLLKWVNPTTTAFVVLNRRADRSPSAFQPHSRLAWVPLRDIAPAMALAVLVGEDPYFFWHAGFNPIEILRAHRYNREERALGRNLRGGSTITQQLAKNLFLSPAQSYIRKFLEAVFTALIEGLWSKRRILEMYLNVVQFGPAVFGADAAAKHYFQRPPLGLTPEQAALLTAALRGPRLYCVEKPPAAMYALQASILQRMQWCGEGMLAQLGERGS